MVLKYHISPSAITEDFVVKIWEASNDAPGAEVYTSPNIPAPHAAPYTVTVNGLDKVVHVVRLYGVTSSNLYHDFNAEPKTDIVTVFQPIRFKIGDGNPNTPVAGTDTYTNAALIGLGDDDYVVHRNTYGNLFPGGVHYTNDPMNGGFVLNPGDIFNDQEEFTILQQPKAITTVVNDSVVGKWFGGFLDVPANISYNATHLRKLIRFTGNADYSFDIAPPVGYGYPFQNFANAITGKVKFNNAPLKWGGTTKAEIEIPSYCEACFTWDGSFWHVVYLSQSTWVNAATVQPLQIIGAGNFNIGDVPVGDIGYEITHNKSIAGDYLVLLSIKSADGSNMANNDKIGITWQHHPTDKPNKFKIAVKELAAQVQNIAISWLIIKL